MTVDRRWRIALRTVALGYLALLLLIPIGLVFYRTFEHGVGAVWDSVTTPGRDLGVLADDHGDADRGAAEHGLRRALRAGARARPLPRQDDR